MKSSIESAVLQNDSGAAKHTTIKYTEPGIRPKPTLSGFPGPVNIGNPYEVNIRSIAENVIQLTGSQSTIIFEDFLRMIPEGDAPILQRRGITCNGSQRSRSTQDWRRLQNILKLNFR